MTELKPIEQDPPEPQEEELPDANFPRQEYIGGPAGTGKTFLMRERQAKHKGVVLAATTGIAAVNLGEGVTTINSLLGYYDTASLRDTWSQGFLSRKLARLARSGLRQIVLDEVSMLDAEQLTILTAAIEEVNQQFEGEASLGITLTGDFCQLPPIKAAFAFESDAWESYDQNKTMLSKFYRQTDPKFLEALQHARRGEGAAAVEYFEPFFEMSQDPDYPNVTLLSKNDEVDRFNLLRLSKVKGEKISWRSERWGKPKSEWKLIPERLELKAGAQVMLLANEREYDDDGQPGRILYANGDLAEVLDDPGMVRLKRNGEELPVQPVTRRNLEVPEAGRAKELKAQGKVLHLVCLNMGCRPCWKDEGGRGDCKDARYEIVGECTYMPMRLAYAVTVHKSQGLTMDQVQVDFRDRFFDSPGMLYVALSRVRTPEGLRLVGRADQFVRRCRADPKVGRWL